MWGTAPPTSPGLNILREVGRWDLELTIFAECGIEKAFVGTFHILLAFKQYEIPVVNR